MFKEETQIRHWKWAGRSGLGENDGWAAMMFSRSTHEWFREKDFAWWEVSLCLSVKRMGGPRNCLYAPLLFIKVSERRELDKCFAQHSLHPIKPRHHLLLKGRDSSMFFSIHLKSWGSKQLLMTFSQHPGTQATVMEWGPGGWGERYGIPPAWKVPTGSELYWSVGHQRRSGLCPPAFANEQTLFTSNYEKTN